MTHMSLDESRRLARSDIWRRGTIPFGEKNHPPGNHWWLSTDSFARYDPSKSAYGLGDVFYKINSNGYRSIEFDPTSTKKKILFVGDSLTVGVGLPYKDNWTTIFTTELGNRDGCEYEQHNLGVAGISNDVIAQIAFQAIPIIKPVLVLALFTESSRLVHFPRYDERVDIRAQQSNGRDQNIADGYFALQTDANDMFRFVRSFNIIDSACRIHNIPWMWSHWPVNNLPLSEMSDLVDMSNHFERPDKIIDRARDGLHPGHLWNSELAASVLKAYAALQGISSS